MYHDILLFRSIMYSDRLTPNNSDVSNLNIIVLLQNMICDTCIDVSLYGSVLQNDLHRVMMKSQSALSQQIMILIATIVCLVITR